MLKVSDDVLVVMNPGEYLAAANEPALPGKAEEGIIAKASYGDLFVFRVGRQPDIGHAAAINQFLEIKPAERPWNRRFGGAPSL